MMYKIGYFSRLCRVTVRTLRYYDEIGLLKPIQVDQTTGYRYYSIDQLQKLNRINMLKGIGLSLDDISGLLHNDMPADYIRQLLQVKKSEIQERINQDNRKLHQVDVWLNRINMEGVTSTDIFIQRKSAPALRVISKRGMGTYEETTAKLYGEVKSQIDRTENQETVKITGPVMGLFYDDEYKDKDADIEMAIPISGEISVDEENIEIKTLPKYEVLSAIHRGPYYSMEKVYAQIMEYAEEHGLELAVPSRELYFTYLEEIPEKEHLTEIQFPFIESVPYSKKDLEKWDSEK
jgi:effector-binding domain-containing protein